MCGIAGLLGPIGSQIDLSEILRRMTDELVHRGPDAVGYWLDETVAVGLGHRRLSILDLSSAGCQPMHSASSRYVCVLNGEIYNFRDLRTTLIAQGARFHTATDTEVVLAAFERWGILEAVKRFVGMFALGVWDRLERTLYLIRDRIGEKPLYYTWAGDTLIFGSELKSLRVHPQWTGTIDRGTLSSFLRLGYVPGDECIYQGVKKVTPGTIVTINASNHTHSVTRYWYPGEIAEQGLSNPMSGSPSQIMATLEKQLVETISQQMVADVPLGAFLSGGIDSSLIVALMQAQSGDPVHTFTIAFEEEAFNEAVHAAAVAKHLGTTHTEFVVTGNEARAVIPVLPTLYDEPFADSSQIPTYLVSALARRHVTVSLSGDGGDELFGGYGRYTEVETRWRTIARIPRPARLALSWGLTAVPAAAWDLIGRSRASRLDLVRRINPSADRIGRLADVLSAKSHDQLYNAIVSHWREASTVALGGPHSVRAMSGRVSEMAVVPRMMLRDLTEYLPDDILVKVDRASMGVSLETRAPFLDHRVVELAWRIPMSMKVRGGTGKWILRQLLDKYVPLSIMDRPKMGFGVPLGRWLRGPLRGWADDLLNADRLRAEGYLNAGLVARRWSEHRSGRRNWEHLLWDILMFEAWLASHPAHRLAVAA